MGVHIEADVQAALVLILIVRDVLTVVHGQLGTVAELHHLVVVIIRVAGPVDVIVHLKAGDGTALRVVGIQAQTLLSHVSGGGEGYFAT